MITVAIVGATLIVLGLGVSGYFAYLTEGSEPNRHDALVPGRELCFEDYPPPRATSSMAKSSEESTQEKIVRRTGS